MFAVKLGLMNVTISPMAPVDKEGVGEGARDDWGLMTARRIYYLGFREIGRRRGAGLLLQQPIRLPAAAASPACVSTAVVTASTAELELPMLWLLRLLLGFRLLFFVLLMNWSSLYCS